MNKSRLKKIYIILYDFSMQIKKANLASFAGSTAFFLFLSLVPMLMVICSVIPYTPLTENDIVIAFTDVTPDMADALVESIINEVYTESAGVMSLAILVTIWSAGQGVLALIRGLNSIYGIPEKRNYILLRLIASLYTIIMLVVLILSLFVMVFGNQLVDFVLYRIPPLHYIVEFIMHFRFIFVWAILTFLFSALYAFLPNKKNSYNEQIPGAAFSAILWGLFSYAFSLYVDRFNDFGLYGSISIIIVIMVWMYICMYIILIGAYLNKYFKPINRVLVGKRQK